MGELVTITVDRDDIETLCGLAVKQNGVLPLQAGRRILAALPQPEWEPSEAQKLAFHAAYGHGDQDTAWTIAHLTKLHKAGFDLTLRDDRG